MIYSNYMFERVFKRKKRNNLKENWIENKENICKRLRKIS